MIVAPQWLIPSGTDVPADILKAIIDGAKIAENPLGWICPEIPIPKKLLE